MRYRDFKHHYLYYVCRNMIATIYTHSVLILYVFGSHHASSYDVRMARLPSVCICLCRIFCYIKILTIIQTDVRSSIIAKYFLSAGAFTRIDKLEPIRPPMKAAMASGKEARMLKDPPIKCPERPAVAVAATMSEEVPIATRTGTRPISTMAGSLKMPPAIPIIPATKPATAVTGIRPGSRTT